MNKEYAGKLIRELRKSKGLTLEDVAGKDFTKGYISLLERGKVSPSFKVLTHIAEKLGTDVTRLLSDDSLEVDLAVMEADFIFKKYMKVISDTEEIEAPVGSPLGIKVLLLKSKALFHLGKHDECIKNLEIIMCDEKDWSLVYRLEAFHYLSRSLTEKQMYLEALEMYNKGIEFANKHDLEWHELIANMFLNKATVLQIMEKYQDAILVYNKCLEYSKKFNILEPVLDSFIRLGFCYYASDDIDLAKEYASKALNINEILDLRLPQADTSLLLSQIYLSEGDLELAEEHAEKSCKLYDELLRGEPYIGALFTLADIYKRRKRINEAKEVLNKLYLHANDLTLSSSLMDKVANICVELELSNIANAFYSKLVKSLREIK